MYEAMTTSGLLVFFAADQEKAIRSEGQTDMNELTENISELVAHRDEGKRRQWANDWDTHGMIHVVWYHGLLQNRLFFSGTAIGKPRKTHWHLGEVPSEYAGYVVCCV